MTATGMLVKEWSDVVNESGYEDQRSSLRLFLNCSTRWCKYEYLDEAEVKRLTALI